MSAHEDTWNANDLYIHMIMQIIQDYTIAMRNRNYDQMLNHLVLLETLISPKVDNDEAENLLGEIESDIGKMILYDDAGTIIKYYPEMIRITVQKCNKVLALLLCKMEDAGMLTRKKLDPRQAMGKFKGG